MKKISTKTLFFKTIAVLLLISALFFYSYFWIFLYPNHQLEKTYYEQKCQSFEVQNFNLSKGQIVFIGDSITDLYPLDSYYSDLPLAVYNRGIAGDRTDGVIDRLKVSLYDISPSKIVLMIGINDINSGRNNDEIISNYTKILAGIKQNLPNTQVFCISVLSVKREFEQYFDLSKIIPQIKDLNSKIENLAQTYSYTFLDLFSLTADQDSYLISTYSDDGIHLNSNGFTVWTNLVKPYLV